MTAASLMGALARACHREPPSWRKRSRRIRTFSNVWGSSRTRRVISGTAAGRRLGTGLRPGCEAGLA